jgi:hypothetical protein
MKGNTGGPRLSIKMVDGSNGTAIDGFEIELEQQVDGIWQEAVRLVTSPHGIVSIELAPPAGQLSRQGEQQRIFCHAWPHAVTREHDHPLLDSGCVTGLPGAGGHRRPHAIRHRHPRGRGSPPSRQ